MIWFHRFGLFFYLAIVAFDTLIAMRLLRNMRRMAAEKSGSRDLAESRFSLYGEAPTHWVFGAEIDKTGKPLQQTRLSRTFERPVLKSSDPSECHSSTCQLIPRVLIS